MKISKVDHTRMGAAPQKDSQGHGFLYKTPVGKGESPYAVAPGGNGTETAEAYGKYIEKLNKNAKNLYNVLNPVILPENKNSSDYGRMLALRNLGQQVNSFFRNILRNNTTADGIADALRDSALTGVLNDASYDDLTKELVSSYLRKSLRRTVHGHDLANITECLLLEKMGIGHEVPSEEDVAALAGTLFEDFTKTRQIRNIAHSLMNQDVKVQPEKSNDRYLLTLANANHPKKAWIFRFLRNYTAQDEKGQEALLVEIRKLMLLFFCGESAYKEADDLGVGAWTFGYVFKEKEENAVGRFSDAAEAAVQYENTDRSDNVSRTEQKRKAAQAVRYAIGGCYQNASKYLGETDCVELLSREDGLGWLGYFERCAEQLLLSSARGLDSRKVNAEYLCGKTWGMFTAFIAQKFIEIGKAVYHFVIPKNPDVCSGKNISVCEVLPEYRGGLTSFDYEWIKAEDSVTRELSTYAVFAAHNYCQSVSDGASDVLDVLKSGAFRQDARMRVLRYFGGMSTWKDSDIEAFDDTELIRAVGREIAAVRNSTFHYAGSGETGLDEDDLLIISALFDTEHSRVGALRRKKYYSNNALLFYAEDDITKLMNYLYSGPKTHPAQIPSFQKILNKNSIFAYDRFIKGKNKRRISAPELTDKFKGCIFYILKECYYYGFLPDPGAAAYVVQAVNEIKAEATGDRLKAAENFSRRFDAVSEGAAIGEICQNILSDYASQNNELRRVKTARNAANDRHPAIYQHFKMLLYDAIRRAFWTYLKAENNKPYFEFLRTPVIMDFSMDQTAEDAFCSGWQDHSFDDILGAIQNASAESAWYIAAHFIAPSQLNHLIGSLKTYEQYTGSIIARAKWNGITDEKRWKNHRDYSRLLRILSFTQMFSGMKTNAVTDYFGTDAEEANEAYAAFLGNYIDFKNKKTPQNWFALQEFCSRPESKSPSGNLGLYYDGLNPVVNRNVVTADMYGSAKVLSHCVKKVSDSDIRRYYSTAETLAGVFKKGCCEDEKEQKNLKNFQNQKNRVELLDIANFTEILNDLYARLVSWSYLRERDMMYLQLGYHYVELYHTDKAVDDRFRRLIGDDAAVVEGALLYQITAMYTYGMPVFGYKEGRPKKKSGNMQTSAKVGVFYKDYCEKDESVYNAGLCFFEPLPEHDAIIRDIRNPIDHFHYYDDQEESILELYSSIYNRFFGYDSKLKKNVPVAFTNVLAQHFLLGHIVMEPELHPVRISNHDTCERRMAVIKFRKDNLSGKKPKYGLEADQMTYKIPGLGAVKLDAKDRIYVEQVQKMLEYKAEMK